MESSSNNPGSPPPRHKYNTRFKHQKNDNKYKEDESDISDNDFIASDDVEYDELDKIKYRKLISKLFPSQYMDKKVSSIISLQQKIKAKQHRGKNSLFEPNTTNIIISRPPMGRYSIRKNKDYLDEEDEDYEDLSDMEEEDDEYEDDEDEEDEDDEDDENSITSEETHTTSSNDESDSGSEDSTSHRTATHAISSLSKELMNNTTMLTELTKICNTYKHNTDNSSDAVYDGLPDNNEHIKLVVKENPRDLESNKQKKI